MSLMNVPLLTINNLEAVYDGVILALRSVSLIVREGRVVTLLGANGSGKSTTLKACSNLLRSERGRVTRGHIALEGRDIAGMSAHQLVRAGIVQVLEGRHCFAHLTVEENLLTGSLIRREQRDKIQDSLDYVYCHFPEIAKHRKRQAGYLSGGQ